MGSHQRNTPGLELPQKKIQLIYSFIMTGIFSIILSLACCCFFIIDWVVSEYIVLTVALNIYSVILKYLRLCF